MNKLSFILIALSLILQAGFSPVHAQHEHKHQHKHVIVNGKPTIVCSYSKVPIDRYIPPPEAYTSRLKSGQEPGAEFRFIINGSPSALVPAALERAGEIWGSLIYSPVPITVEVNFEDLGEGTLGATGPAWPPYILDNNGTVGERIYVHALSEKLLRRNLNGDEYDMRMTYNNNRDYVRWYYGLDGATPPDRQDFLSVILHEIAHGLGFFGFYGVDDNGMGYGTTVPGIFDGFLQNDQGEWLHDTIVFPKPSREFGDALTTPPITFISSVVSNALPEEAPGPRLFVPPTWRPGNSLYHLQDRYNTLNEGRDALMTYAQAPGSAVHDPGPVLTNMLYELGWVHTYVLHDTLKDRETIADPFTVSATIIGDKGVEEGSQYVYYSFDGFATSDSLMMEKSDSANEFTSNIPVISDDVTVSYFISTRDSLKRTYTMPPEAPEKFYSFVIGTDQKAPSIDHTPVQFALSTYDSLEIVAGIWDNLGLASTQVEYKINDVDQTPVELSFDTLVSYSGSIRMGEGIVKGGDLIKYRIKAVDASAAGHTTYDPATGYHEFTVEDIPPFVDYYFNDLDTGINNFLVDRFYHSKPAGFSSYGLHTDHPYPSPNKDDGEDRVFAQLKIPIRLNSGMMQLIYDEIAYIENGDPGSEFGDDNFWDYVIVEGSKDGGNTWHPFIDGYDCRYWSLWSNDFMDDRKQDANNYLSTAVPDESAMKEHRINLFSAPEFEEDDVVLIRWRLEIDPYYSGWGWVIDNIEIKPLLTGAQDLAILADAIEIYPNPSSGVLTVKMPLALDVDELKITVLDMVGRAILSESYRDPGRSFQQYFDLGGLPGGIYLMRFSSGNESHMKKIILSR